MIVLKSIWNSSFRKKYIHAALIPSPYPGRGLGRGFTQRERDCLSTGTNVAGVLALHLSRRGRNRAEEHQKTPVDSPLPALKRRRTLLQKCLHRLAMVFGAAGHGLPPRLAVEQLVELMSDRGVKICLHVAVGDRRPIRDS